ncbi:class II glutamine amidotransferase [Fontimonas sp. SYSU GA230001]|uniref:class II glutamine amidotransferase n=1 Tax=Fontimonas sp. SYSU GA230001 TaxID=3142450 RepID=UPI0032B38754
MCELFAMSSRLPATVRYSFAEFARHGGGTAPHADGWGIGYYVDGDVRVIREAGPAVASSCARLLHEVPFSSDRVIAHIRLATRGDRALRNTQPFQRELGGRMHLFAHNGALRIEPLQPMLRRDGPLPVGETDSELAFCLLLQRLRPLWLASEGMPPAADRLAVVVELAALLRPLGPANFLYCDGDLLFVHAHRRTQAPGRIEPPGLHLLERHCPLEMARVEVPGLEIGAAASGAQDVALVASVPLTDEAGWRPLAEGEVLAIRGGRVLNVQPAAR